MYKADKSITEASRRKLSYIWVTIRSIYWKISQVLQLVSNIGRFFFFR